MTIGTFKKSRDRRQRTLRLLLNWRRQRWLRGALVCRVLRLRTSPLGGGMEKIGQIHDGGEIVWGVGGGGEYFEPQV